MYIRKYMNKKVLQENAGIKADTYIDKMYFDSSELIGENNTLIEYIKYLNQGQSLGILLSFVTLVWVLCRR